MLGAKGVTEDDGCGVCETEVLDMAVVEGMFVKDSDPEAVEGSEAVLEDVMIVAGGIATVLEEVLAMPGLVPLLVGVVWIAEETPVLSVTVGDVAELPDEETTGMVVKPVSAVDDDLTGGLVAEPAVGTPGDDSQAGSETVAVTVTVTSRRDKVS